jgi:DNA invertase Pin-like site-specific DNA recombinase
MKTAVIYARYSSSNQREESIAGQIRECRQYAERHNLQVIHEYTDSALTGTSDKRPAFQQMIRDSDRKQFDVVIVWKIDRFARNRYDAAMYRHMLKENGVKVVSAMESISDTPEGIILEGLMESLAEYYSANLAENVKRGLYDSALERKVLSRPTYGYKRGIDGRYEIDDMQAVIVRRVFKEYADGKPYMQILDDLNADGITTGNGNRFTKNSLRKILRNEKYVGVYRYKDIIDEKGIPAIIDRDLFDRVQAELKRRSFTRKRKAPADGEEYILTGKLFCGHCGSQMIGDSVRKRNGKIYRYYTCAGVKTKKNACTKKRVNKDWIESEVMRIINDEILTDTYIDLVTAEVLRYQETAEVNSTLQYLQEQKAQTDRKISNILKAITDGIWSESTGELLRSLEDAQRRIETQIQHERLTRRVFTAEDVKAFLYALKRSEKTDSEAQRYLINSCIGRIYLFDDDDGQRLVIDINYSTDDSEPVRYDTVRKMSAVLCLCRDKRTVTESDHVLLSVFVKA